MKREEIQETRILPSGYRQLEYLESTGTQYILTNIYPDNTYTFDAIVGKTSNSPQNCVYFGVRSAGAWDTENWQCYLNSNLTATEEERYQITLYSTSPDLFSSNWTSGIIPTVGTMYNLTGMTVVQTMNAMIYPIAMFGFNILGSINTSVGICRIGEFTAYSGGTKFCDFIPTLRISDSKPGLYDTVNNLFYTNNGSGEFLYA